jgi:hypothetical protein
MRRPTPAPKRAAPTHIVIASDSGETIDGLQSYLQRAGLTARGIRRLDDDAFHDANVNAIVLFADDFAPGEVVTTVDRLLRARPNVLPMIVTRDPMRFEVLIRDSGREVLPIILPKPAWGWTILDSIRARMES